MAIDISGFIKSVRDGIKNYDNSINNNAWAEGVKKIACEIAASEIEAAGRRFIPNQSYAMLSHMSPHDREKSIRETVLYMIYMGDYYVKRHLLFSSHNQHPLINDSCLTGPIDRIARTGDPDHSQ